MWHNGHDKLSYILVYCCIKQGISINAETYLSSFWIRNSFTSMDSKASNDATDEHKGGILANILMMRKH